jgi:hypothetical protein
VDAAEPHDPVADSLAAIQARLERGHEELDAAIEQRKDALEQFDEPRKRSDAEAARWIRTGVGAPPPPGRRQ